MPTPSRGPLVMPSVLDRLLDDAPDNREREGFMAFDIAHFRRAIGRDLEVLLNTRTHDLDTDFSDWPLAHESLLSFGIPDLSSLSLSNPDHRELLRNRLHQAITRHEPRLSRVSVHIDIPREEERDLHFRIDAILKVHPERPPVQFDAMVQLASSACRVQ